MDEKLTKIDASPEAKGLDRDLQIEAPKTVAEFDVLLSRYKKQSPESYERKLGNGTFAKQAKALGIAWNVVVEETFEDTKEEVGDELTETPKRGRKKKEEVI